MDVVDIFQSSFSVWRRNLNLGLPYFASNVAQIFLVAVAIAVGLIMLFGLAIPSAFFMPELSMGTIVLVIALVSITLVVLAAVGAYFHSMGIGMALEVTNKKKPSFKGSQVYGSRFWFRMFLVDLAIVLIELSVLAILGAISFLGPYLIMQASGYETAAAVMVSLLVLLFAFIPVLVIIMVISFAMLFSQYALVIDNTTATEALKRSYRLFRRNWLEVIGISLGLFIVGLAVGIAVFVIAIPLFILMVTLQLVFAGVGHLVSVLLEILFRIGFWLLLIFFLTPFTNLVMVMAYKQFKKP
jgi:hypothetical protein